MEQQREHQPLPGLRERIKEREAEQGGAREELADRLAPKYPPTDPEGSEA